MHHYACMEIDSLNHDQTYIHKCAPNGDLLVHLINFLGDLRLYFFPRFILYNFFLFLLIYGGLRFWGGSLGLGLSVDGRFLRLGLSMLT